MKLHNAGYAMAAALQGVGGLFAAVASEPLKNYIAS